MTISLADAYIMVVEDDPDAHLIMLDLLRMAGAKRCYSRKSVASAIQFAAKLPRMDLFLADINMPKMNGHRLRRRLQREHPEHAKIPFIFVSALADETDIADGRLIGVEHYVTKPIDFGELLGWIKDLTSA